MEERDLKDRTKRFAVRTMSLVAALPRNMEGQILGRQLLRSATSAGADYRAACRARSRADFISKLGIVEEETDESAFWIELIIERELVKKAWVVALLDEADQLLAIFTASRITAGRAQANQKSKIKNQKS